MLRIKYLLVLKDRYRYASYFNRALILHVRWSQLENHSTLLQQSQLYSGHNQKIIPPYSSNLTYTEVTIRKSSHLTLAISLILRSQLENQPTLLQQSHLSSGHNQKIIPPFSSNLIYTLVTIRKSSHLSLAISSILWSQLLIQPTLLQQSVLRIRIILIRIWIQDVKKFFTDPDPG